MNSTTVETHAVTFVKLIQELIAVSVRESIGPVQCYAGLQVARRAVELALSPVHAANGREYAEDFMSSLPDEAIRAFATQGFAAVQGSTIPEPLMHELVDQAAKAIVAVGGTGDPLRVLIVLHIASQMSMAMLKSETPDGDQLASILSGLISARRQIDRVDFEVHRLTQAMSKGGDA